ncbi:hypothetical protein RZS28_07460 [Methylocapsa polymorpha]|uniref:Secreted peptide n=1 Tax=Methylocapsa polymorpha TaxID=3080828 RepID=A0ABZ0HUZ9_9HYPH|nr:hypothetical protein RZS28_07460 [Methylocapsa sp. RX1]
MLVVMMVKVAMVGVMAPVMLAMAPIMFAMPAVAIAITTHVIVHVTGTPASHHRIHIAHPMRVAH